MSTTTYDTWRLARSQEHFEKLVHNERSFPVYTFRQLCIRTLRLCKNLPYSPITWVFLILLGALSAMYGLLVDAWVQYLFKARRFLMETAGPDTFWGFVVWMGWCVTISTIATCVPHYMSLAADGSGIPRMRALFAGVYQDPHEVLSVKTFIAKSISTVLSSGSGLSVGRAGPYTHIVSIMAYQMNRWNIFRRTYFGPETFSYLRAAVACGVTASFGSPLGGVLFGIEVTAKQYEIKCLWEGVISSSVCILVFKIITFLKRDVLFERTTFTGFEMDWDIVAFTILGVITGIGAGLFCQFSRLLRVTQNKMFAKLGIAQPCLKRRMIHILTVTIATACITYPIKIMRLSDRAFVNEVFRDQDLSLPQWTQLTEFPRVTLFIYCCLKFFTSVLPCGAPLSIGIFGPLFTIGAAFGRLYGEALVKYWEPTQSPATYAVVGAACFAASATQTVSTPVVFFELTGQLSHMIPLQIACIVSYFVSGSIAPSIYDILAEWANLHSVCYDFNEYVMSQKYAENNMAPVPVAFTRETTYADAIKALNTHKTEEYFPIVEDHESNILIGAVRRYELEVGIARYFAVNRHENLKENHPAISEKVLRLVSDTLQFDKRNPAEVGDITLLNIQGKDETTTCTTLQFGPPFSPWSFTCIPVEGYPPQVTEDVNLMRVHQLASMYMWTQVYVVKNSRLLGVIYLDKSLREVRKEEPPMLLSA